MVSYLSLVCLFVAVSNIASVSKFVIIVYDTLTTGGGSPIFLSKIVCLIVIADLVSRKDKILIVLFLLMMLYS